jgi:hypothetical protein
MNNRLILLEADFSGRVSRAAGGRKKGKQRGKERKVECRREGRAREARGDGWWHHRNALIFYKVRMESVILDNMTLNFYNRPG